MFGTWESLDLGLDNFLLNYVINRSPDVPIVLQVCANASNFIVFCIYILLGVSLYYSILDVRRSYLETKAYCGDGVSSFLDKLLLWCHTKVQWPLDFRDTNVLKFGVIYLGLAIQITSLETL